MPLTIHHVIQVEEKDNNYLERVSKDLRRWLIYNGMKGYSTNIASL